MAQTGVRFNGYRKEKEDMVFRQFEYDSKKYPAPQDRAVARSYALIFPCPNTPQLAQELHSE